MTPFIQCSERMPDLVLGDPFDGRFKISEPVLIKNDAGHCSVAQWSFSSSQGRGHWTGDKVAHSGPEWEYDGEIIEWMPLPI